MFRTYILMGLAVLVTNDLILAAIGAPGMWKWQAWLLRVAYPFLWPLLLGMWVYRIARPIPEIQIIGRRDRN